MSGGGATWLDRVDEEKDDGKGPVASNSHDSPSNFQQARNSSRTTTILGRPIHYGGGAAAALEQVLVKVFPSSSVLPLLVSGLSLRMVVNHAQTPGTGIFNPSRPHDAAAPP